MNNAVIQGTIATQPQLNTTQKQLATFNLSFPALKEGDAEETIAAIAWGELATTVMNYREGQSVIAEGRVAIKRVDRDSGVKATVTEFNLSRVHVIEASAVPAFVPSAIPAAPAMASVPKAPAMTPVTPVGAIAAKTAAPVAAKAAPAIPADYEPNYDDIPF
jgi:single-stranded DNA-binding protein